jgi:hypothetical protein
MRSRVRIDSAWSLFAIIALGWCGETFAAAPVRDPPSVVIGSLRYIRVNGRSDFEADRATYVHTNHQPLVLEIERTLLGPEVTGDVIVMLDIDRSTDHTIEWATASYGLLTRSEWERPLKLLLVLTKQGRYGNGCVPNIVQEIGGEVHYEDLGLNDFRTAPSYCAKLSEVFRLKVP